MDVQTPLLTNDNILYLNHLMKQTFTAKVYTTVLAQLLITCLFTIICKTVQSVSQFMLGYIGMGVMFVFFNLWICLSVLIFCFCDEIKKKPYNWIFVSTYTCLIAYFMGFIGIQNSSEVLLLSGGSTLFLFSGVTIYALQTKIDYTVKGNYVIIFLLSAPYLIVAFYLNFSLYPLLGAVIFTLYIIHDTQLLLSPWREIKYSPDDYAVASILLYLDIFTLFTYVLYMINWR